jgi:glycerophosphoryl diester phosphodiesterase
MPHLRYLYRVGHSFFKQMGDSPIVVAHRGASDRALENSLAAIALAVADGADMIELDVRLSADGDPVIIHDARTGRTARRNLAVASTSSAVLRRTLLKNGEPLPFLAQALSLIKGDVPVNLHLKKAGCAAAVCRTLADTGYRGEVLLSSGIREECLAAITIRPDIPCGLVTGRPSSSDISFCLRHAVSSIHPDYRRLSVLRIRKVKESGIPLVPYTVDAPETFFELVAGGAAGVFSNRAEALRTAWRAR